MGSGTCHCYHGRFATCKTALLLQSFPSERAEDFVDGETLFNSLAGFALSNILWYGGTTELP